jgi:hypothetical protein
MRRTVAAAISAAALFGLPAAAPAAPPPEGAAMSPNLEYVTRSADARGIVEGKFDRVRGTDVLVVTGRFGFKTYDVSDPEAPELLDTYLPAELAEFGYWQDEDMELDTRRKLIIGALDPRHNDVDPAASGCPHDDALAVRDVDCMSGFYVISYADPSNLKQIGDFVELPAGHTSSCIQGCSYIWTGGPARRDDLPALFPGVWTAFTPGGRGDGRPIWVTDLRNPRKPKVFEHPIDLWRNDGATD